VNPVSRLLPALIWAARDILRRPVQSALVFLTLAAVTASMAAPLLFGHAVDATLSALMESAPDLVVKKLGRRGWAPMNADEAVDRATTVIGVLNPTPRLWGTVNGPYGPVTVVAVVADTMPWLPDGQTVPAPVPGTAVIGAGVAPDAVGSAITLQGAHRLSLKATAAFPEDSGLATHSLVWVAPSDFHSLMGFAPGEVSDLAVTLHRQEELQAIQSDLHAAFPWPVQIVDRQSELLRYHTLLTQKSGFGVAACAPAILALIVLVAGMAAGARSNRPHWGLLKSQGWTTVDIVRHHVVQALMVAAPSIALGVAVAYGAVFVRPIATSLGVWLVHAPPLQGLYLDGTGAVLLLIEIAALVGLPYLAAMLVLTLKSASGEPWELLQSDAWY
jgi:hypothetical protein